MALAHGVEPPPPRRALRALLRRAASSRRGGGPVAEGPVLTPSGPPASFSPPVFVYGATRSGTTVFRLMLNAHSGLSNPGEEDFLFDCIAPDPTHPTGWRYDREALRDHRVFAARGLDLPDGVDGLDLLKHMLERLMNNAAGVRCVNIHRHADRIRAIFPQARVIHMLRDPRDVARSSVGMGWVGISYFGLDHWIRTEDAWDRAAFPDDQVLELRFERLMHDLEGELVRVCAFLGVPFVPEMLEYHRDTTYGPPDPRLTEQWKRRADSHEVALLEGKCGRLLAARGYEPSGPGHRPGPLERRRLKIENRLRRWPNSLRRYGLPLLVGAKLAGWLGASEMHRRLRRQMSERITQQVR
ncbi:sulfotransferase [Jannaschia sp. W003]|uniref:sulfotransferase family protein n=1 Tax=Jannaschia sp. W003 TaxID=2867012 RepID=UPI0021A57F6B|nr:sulfotransferase [Jannaschia sp. W003]UWQ23221.1 sulfotransferase [Jannaschia sp. W003]